MLVVGNKRPEHAVTSLVLVRNPYCLYSIRKLCYSVISVKHLLI